MTYQKSRSLSSHSCAIWSCPFLFRSHSHRWISSGLQHLPESSVAAVQDHKGWVHDTNLSLLSFPRIQVGLWNRQKRLDTWGPTEKEYMDEGGRVPSSNKQASIVVEYVLLLQMGVLLFTFLEFVVSASLHPCWAAAVWCEVLLSPLCAAISWSRSRWTWPFCSNPLLLTHFSSQNTVCTDPVKQTCSYTSQENLQTAAWHPTGCFTKGGDLFAAIGSQNRNWHRQCVCPAL